MKYRKRPVVIEAIQWTGKNLVEITEFMEQKPLELTNSITSKKWDDYCDIIDRDGLTIHTLEGEMKASKGDFIIRGVNGELYPCKPDIFEKTYEGVSKMTSKEKAIEALDKDIITLAEIIVHYSQDEWLGKDEIQRLRNYITQPTLDDAIAAVEKMFEKENERLRKIIQAYYSKSWLVTLSKNILAYNIKFQMGIQTALEGLKEGK